MCRDNIKNNCNPYTYVQTQTIGVNMKSKPRNKIYTQDTYNGFSLQKKHGDLVEHYLSRINDVFDNAIAEYPRTCAIRVDLRLPKNEKGYSTNVISKFIDSIKAQVNADLIKKKRSGGRERNCSVRYVWVKERNSSLKDHYHLILLFNNDVYNCLGSFTASSGNLSARIKKAWSSALGIDYDSAARLAHFPDNCVYKINLNSPSFDEDLDKLFHRVSYFAKTETKRCGDRSKNFGASRR